MRAIVQRVSKASVEVNQNEIGAIQKGYLVYLGITHIDTIEIADKLIEKLLKIRLFPSEGKAINANISSVEGEILVVSQFTLYAATKKGNRPSFMDAAKPDQAESLYDYVVKKLGESYSEKVAAGQFGADMKVTSVNDGPINIILDV
ncbi:MAG: D-aminoacyl-tRNA deacylase, partial [Psychroflexus sp.]|nr:D-aminoacyl-tRNA deacylase [Psychroflexus sp.]